MSPDAGTRGESTGLSFPLYTELGGRIHSTPPTAAPLIFSRRPRGVKENHRWPIRCAARAPISVPGTASGAEQVQVVGNAQTL